MCSSDLIGSFISGATLIPDFIRFAKSKKVGVAVTIISFLVGNSLMFFFGAISAIATGRADISEVIYLHGFVLIAFLVLGLNIWTTNDNALYVSGLAFANITQRPKRACILVNGIVGTLLALLLFNNFMGWLTFLNSFMPGIGGIIIADYFILHKGKYASLKEHDFVEYNKIAFFSWVISVASAHLMGGIAPINSVFIAIVAYVGITKLNVFLRAEIKVQRSL